MKAIISALLAGLSIVCAVGLVCCLFMFIRNQWVFKHRVKLAGTTDYDRLPSYDEMMKRWWVWDIKKFLKEP